MAAGYQMSSTAVRAIAVIAAERNGPGPLSELCDECFSSIIRLFVDVVVELRYINPFSSLKGRIVFLHWVDPSKRKGTPISVFHML